MAKQRLLISLAHPDDESFGLGGVISRYANEGVEVYLICATNGDVGEVSTEMMNGYKTISELRLAELECAASTLGLRKVYKFGYKDSGMGSPTTQDPDCLVYAWEHHPAELTRRVVEVIREVKPQVVITFNRYGAYGHPDHIAIQRATVEAFELTSDPEYVTEGLPPHRPQKLYYNNIPTFMIRIGIWLMRLRRKNPRKVGTNEDIDLVAILDHIDPVHTKIDIKNYLDRWDKANACHASQGGGSGGGLFPQWLRKKLSGNQGLTRVHPQPPRDRVDEDDLFAGVVLEEALADG